MTRDVQVELLSVDALRFDDGRPVRAASAVAPLGDGWLVAQDDATHAAWLRPGATTSVRVFPPVDGLEVFAEHDGTKRLKPDVEAACEVRLDGGAAGVLLLGSGSTAQRMRASLVVPGQSGLAVTVSPLEALYGRVAATLGIDLVHLNLEGACVLGPSLRWFSRGNRANGITCASVDLDLSDLLSAVRGELDPASVRLGHVLRYDLGHVGGVGLAITDAVALPDGSVLVSAAAEDTPDAVADGPVVASVLALVREDAPVWVAPLPTTGEAVHKVEGLGLLDVGSHRARLLGVVDADDPALPSSRLVLAVAWT